MALRGEMVWLFAFDVGQEVLTAAVEVRFPRPRELSGRRKTLPPDVVLYRPLLVGLPFEPVTIGEHPVSLEARVYDAGVVTVSARRPFTTDTLPELQPFHDPRTASGEPLAAVARRVCEQVRDALGDAVRGSTDVQGPETYTAFCLTDLGGPDDALRWVNDRRAEVAGLLTDLDPATVSDGQVTESLHHTVTLERSDAVVIDWVAALVIDLAGGPDEVLYVLEVANLQLLEWKVLDAVLDRHLNRAYEHFARRPGVFSFGWGGVLRELRQLRTDTAKLTDEVSNISKFIGDWYLARVYRAATERFHLDGWRTSLDHRLSQLDRVYAAMQAEVNDRRMLLLEVLIVILITVELLTGFLVRR